NANTSQSTRACFQLTRSLPWTSLQAPSSSPEPTEGSAGHSPPNCSAAAPPSTPAPATPSRSTSPARSRSRSTSPTPPPSRPPHRPTGDVTVLINNAGSATGADLLTSGLDDIHLEMDTR